MLSSVIMYRDHQIIIFLVVNTTIGNGGYYSHGVVGGIFLTTISFPFYLLSSAVCLDSFSSMVFVGRGVISLSSLTVSPKQLDVLEACRKV